MQQFIQHWTSVNAALAPGALLLRGGYTLANFTADRTALQTAITNVEDRNNARQIAANNRDIRKTNLVPRLAQFRASVRYQLIGSAYVPALPRVPDFNRAEGVFLKPFDDMATLWTRINADTTVPGFTPPLLLLGGYTKANFDTDLAALRTAYIAVSTTDEDAKLQRKRRDVLLPAARVRLVQYREAVLARFGPTDPFTLSLPKIAPDPGSTPEPVNLSGIWDATINQARLQWNESDNPNLVKYQVRQSSGPKYKTENESVVADTAIGETTFLTTAGLGFPGTSNNFKVYVIVDDDNEAGSNAVRITRA